MTFHERASDGYPVFGICGFSGSGKTTLIEALVRVYRGRGLKVGVIKHDAHGIELDHKNKDTDRLFMAGGDVLIENDHEIFVRLHRLRCGDLNQWIADAAPYYDLIFVEGHKRTPLPWKIWLCRDGEETHPPEAVNIVRCLKWAENRDHAVLEMLDRRLLEIWRATPVYAGILPGDESGGGSQGKLEKLVSIARAQVHRVVLLECGTIPETLRDVPALPSVTDGPEPLRGMRAAMRWAPRVSWLFLTPAQLSITPALLEWILAQRQPGVRAIMPLVNEGAAPDPRLAWYDFRMAPVLEQVAHPYELPQFAGVATPPIPSDLVAAQAVRTRPPEKSSLDY